MNDQAEVYFIGGPLDMMKKIMQEKEMGKEIRIPTVQHRYDSGPHHRYLLLPIPEFAQHRFRPIYVGIYDGDKEDEK